MLLTTRITGALALVAALSTGCDAPGDTNSYRNRDASIDVESVIEDDGAWDQALPKTDEAAKDGAKELLACDPDYFAELSEGCIATGDCKGTGLPEDSLPDEACLADDIVARPSCSAGQIGTCTAGGTRACLRDTWLGPGLCASITGAACAYACCTAGHASQCYNWN